jgi:hypothetical protein
VSRRTVASTGGNGSEGTNSPAQWQRWAPPAQERSFVYPSLLPESELWGKVFAGTGWESGVAARHLAAGLRSPPPNRKGSSRGLPRLRFELSPPDISEHQHDQGVHEKAGLRAEDTPGHPVRSLERDAQQMIDWLNEGHVDSARFVDRLKAIFRIVAPERNTFA